MQSGHSGQLSVLGGDQELKGPGCGRWVCSIGGQTGPWVPQVVRMSVTLKKNPTRVTICCRKGEPFQSPRVGSCLTLRNELSKETHVPTKQETLLGRSIWVKSSMAGESRRTALPHAHSLGFYGNGIRFWVVFGQSFWLRVLPGGTRIGSAKMGAREKDSRRWSEIWCFLLAFPELFWSMVTY